MNLKQLAETAATYYNISLPTLRSPCSKAKYVKPRHMCQWIANDAGYTKSVIARFWKRDRQAIYYGCRVVQCRLDTSEAAVEEMKSFMKHIKTTNSPMCVNAVR